MQHSMQISNCRSFSELNLSKVKKEKLIANIPSFDFVSEAITSHVQARSLLSNLCLYFFVMCIGN